MSGLTWNPRVSIDTIRKQSVEKIPSLSRPSSIVEGQEKETVTMHDARSSKLKPDLVLATSIMGVPTLEHEQRNETRVGNPWKVP